jgi:hypothetical protein
MKIWTTLVYAKCAETNEYRTFCGQNIEAPTKKLAHEYCQNNGLGYLHISDELIMEIPCKSKTDYSPDWDKAIDYGNIQNN